MEPASDVTPAPATIPVGRSGRLEAMALAAAGDHAVLVREASADKRGRALITTDKLPSGERLVIMPLDEEVDVRVDGDALAVWLGAGSIQQVPQQHVAVDARQVPVWATLAGGALLLLVVAFAVIGSAVTFAWLMSLVS
jgi:hypothetical protein